MFKMSKDVNTDEAIAALTESIKAHDDALGALKDVPSILNEVAKAVGLKQNKESTKPKGYWSLGLTDDEDEVEIVDKSDQNTNFDALITNLNEKSETGYIFSLLCHFDLLLFIFGNVYQ